MCWVVARCLIFCPLTPSPDFFLRTSLSTKLRVPPVTAPFPSRLSDAGNCCIQTRKITPPALPRPFPALGLLSCPPRLTSSPAFSSHRRRRNRVEALFGGYWCTPRRSTLLLPLRRTLPVLGATLPLAASFFGPRQHGAAGASAWLWRVRGSQSAQRPAPSAVARRPKQPKQLQRAGDGQGGKTNSGLDQQQEHK